MQAGTLAKGIVAVLLVGACLATSADARYRRSSHWAEPSASVSRGALLDRFSIAEQGRNPMPSGVNARSSSAYPSHFRRSGGLAAVTTG